ncbi:MAG: hypothetical protein M1838_004362 [Thelocarpon superellum]|nr:MAG: hypothetical protein M1838_004362 [Thelocarpon superellum]
MEAAQVRASEDELESVYLDSMGNPFACVCNTTYTSYACCDAPTGIIWELPGRNLGPIEEEL